MSETDSAAASVKQPSRLGRAFRSLKDRRMAAMIILAFTASLPYGAVLGILTAWLESENIGPAVIGALSLATMGYSFKYLWAPGFQKARELPFLKIGGRRSWLIALQFGIAILLGVLAFSNPAQNIGLVAVIAFAITILSPTHDLILDAWRIEVARSEEDKDLMSALYQFGYKFGGFVSGFIALIMAERIGWVAVYFMIAAFVLLGMIGTLIAPEPEETEESLANERQSFLPALPRSIAMPAVIGVALSWLIAISMILWFVVGSLILQNGVKGSDFVKEQGPWVVGLTVGLPALVSAILLYRYQATAQTVSTNNAHLDRSSRLLETLFRAIFDPMMDLIFRLRWGFVLVILLALTYRFTDAVWGSFAYWFYMGENFGALGHSGDDVAIASKFFGVIATILGALIGASMMTMLGRMPVLLLGGIVAAATNLLYADLAIGGAGVDAFLAFTHLDAPLIRLSELGAHILQTQGAAEQADYGQRMARLMVTIFAENIAGGIALVAITAYLTSVVNPRFAAVQYALLASLTMLIGTLGKPWLGEMMETKGFYYVFMVTFWLGGIAVVLCVIEWIRQARGGAHAVEKPDPNA